MSNSRLAKYTQFKKLLSDPLSNTNIEIGFDNYAQPSSIILEFKNDKALGKAVLKRIEETNPELLSPLHSSGGSSIFLDLENVKPEHIKILSNHIHHERVKRCFPENYIEKSSINMRQSETCLQFKEEHRKSLRDIRKNLKTTLLQNPIHPHVGPVLIIDLNQAKKMDDKTLKEYLQPKQPAQKNILQAEIQVKFSSAEKINKRVPDNLFSKIPEIKKTLGSEWKVTQHEKHFNVSHTGNKGQFTITPDELKTKQPNYEVLKGMSKVSTAVKKDNHAVVTVTNFSKSLNQAFDKLVQKVKAWFPQDTIKQNVNGSRKSMKEEKQSQIDASPRKRTF